MKKCHGFSKVERLRKNFEFKRVRNKGTSCRDGVFILSMFKNDIGHHRLGVSIGSSTLRLASDRNRLKRLIREAFRLNKSKLKAGYYDIIVSMKRRLDGKVNYSAIEKRLLTLLRKAKVL